MPSRLPVPLNLIRLKTRHLWFHGHRRATKGISVATSVMAFEYRDRQNQHSGYTRPQRFLRKIPIVLCLRSTVSLLVIDVAKGRRTNRKLVKYVGCEIPPLLFFNKLDREGKDAFDPSEWVEENCASKSSLVGPIGMGTTISGSVQFVWKNWCCLVRMKQLEDEVISIGRSHDQRTSKHVWRKGQMNRGRARNHYISSTRI